MMMWLGYILNSRKDKTLFGFFTKSYLCLLGEMEMIYFVASW